MGSNDLCRKAILCAVTFKAFNLCFPRPPFVSVTPPLSLHLTSCLSHTHTPPAGLTRHLTPPMIGLYARPAPPPSPLRSPRLVNAVYLVCSVSAVKGYRCQSSQIASAPPFSVRMSPTVAESSGSNYQHNAGDSPSVRVGTLTHTFSPVHGRRGVAEQLKTPLMTPEAEIFGESQTCLDPQRSRNFILKQIIVVYGLHLIKIWFRNLVQNE